MSRLALLLAAALSLPQVAAGACAPVFADADAAVEFRQTITAYYDCDRISRGRMLSAAEAAACSHLYEATKSYFPAEDGQSPYVAFKCWELENPDLVAAFRSLVVASR